MHEVVTSDVWMPHAIDKRDPAVRRAFSTVERVRVLVEAHHVKELATGVTLGSFRDYDEACCYAHHLAET